jgi:Na+-translocating ferredoxin:NAD+ oxidoreductase RNF subunit RnfB
MGHLAGKDVYRRLGKKLDGLQVRTPWSPALEALLRELYSESEAELIARMPYAPASIDRIALTTGRDPAELQRTLESLCAKGLVIDLWLERSGECQYVISPMVIGIFEFTMMRTAPDADHRRRAHLFRDYLASGEFFQQNLPPGEQVFIGRALPHEETAFSEVLDYERASRIVDQAGRWSIGACSCRHERLHAEGAACATPLATCTSFGTAADYLIRHGFAREAEPAEIRELLARSRESRLVLTADNVQQNVSFICHCCGCCCNLLRGIREHGHTGLIVSSSFVARTDAATCRGCSNCAKACPVDAIAMSRADRLQDQRPVIDEQRCLGCGVCALACNRHAMQLAPREPRVFHPETTFERVLLQSLERGTLQNLVFDNPQSRSDGFFRALVGGFLRLPPVKRALVSDALRSRFLAWAAGRAGEAAKI